MTVSTPGSGTHEHACGTCKATWRCEMARNLFGEPACPVRRGAYGWPICDACHEREKGGSP